MKLLDMFGNPHEYRKKWYPGSSEDYDEYWTMEDQYNCNTFYEVHPKDEKNVTVKFFRGDKLQREREISKAELQLYEMSIGDSYYYREPGERYEF